jgi:hypothetical protein
MFRLIADTFHTTQEKAEPFADSAYERFKERIARLYEQGANINRIGQYVHKWVQWTRSGIRELHKTNILATPEIIQ